MNGLGRMWLPGAWLGVVGAGIFLTIVPQLNAIDRIKAQEKAFTAAYKNNANGADELDRLALRLDDIRAQAEHDTKTIPARGDVAGLIRELTEELDRRGVSEHEIATGAADEIGGVFSIPMSINLTGSFLGVYGAIDWIESMPRLARILRLKIERPSRSARKQLNTSSSDVKAELLINVYYDPAQRDAQLSAADVRGNSS